MGVVDVMKAVTFGACCLILFFVINLAGAASRNTLVIVDDMSMIDSHSQFFALLSDRGHQLDFKLPNDDINFIDMENFQYDSLILFAPSSVDWSAQLDLQNVLQFIDRDGGNVLIAGESKIGFLLTNLQQNVVQILVILETVSLITFTLRIQILMENTQ